MHLATDDFMQVESVAKEGSDMDWSVSRYLEWFLQLLLPFLEIEPSSISTKAAPVTDLGVSPSIDVPEESWNIACRLISFKKSQVQLLNEVMYQAPR